MATTATAAAIASASSRQGCANAAASGAGHSRGARRATTNIASNATVYEASNAA